MPNQIPNVRTWSKTVPPYLFDVGDLDVYVLKEHDEIVAAMGRSRAVQGTWRLLRSLVVLLAFTAPFVSLFFWGYRGSVRRSGRVIRDSGGLDADTAPTASAWCFVAAMVLPVLIAWWWWRRQRQRDTLEVVGLVALVLAGVVILRHMSRRSDVDVLGLAPVSLPVWVTVVGSGVVAALVLVASTGKRVDFERHFSATGPVDVARVQQLVGDLEPRRLEKLMEERRRAIGRLRDRDLIDERRASDLREVPLGLSPTLDTSSNA